MVVFFVLFRGSSVFEGTLNDTKEANRRFKMWLILKEDELFSFLTFFYHGELRFGC